jgi:precorrin-6A/cobalt-precorrin-6A reductase
VLVLGGTGEARELAAALVADGDHVVSSLAGRVSRPRLPVGEVRIGGFGGAAPLASYAREFDVVVDATHPFAATISAHAATIDVPLLRLQRPGWDPTGDWRWAGTHDDAAAQAAAFERPFLTVGRQRLDDFAGPLGDHACLVRLVEPTPMPSAWTSLLSRGPYDVAGESALMRDHGVDVLVTKDSGGDLTRAKLDAARELGVPVVAVRRPPAPPGVDTVSDVDAARRWVRAR